MPTQDSTRTVDEASKRNLAVIARVDPRTIAKELAKPGSVRGHAGVRARAALVEAGLLPAHEAESCAK